MKKHKPNKNQTKKTVSQEVDTTNSTAEVFVLPPELLAKLGINLSNIKQPDCAKSPSQPSTSHGRETEKRSGQEISNHIPVKKHASSILETANLMKESVFLSPTFQTATVQPEYEEQTVYRPEVASLQADISPGNRSQHYPVSMDHMLVNKAMTHIAQSQPAINDKNISSNKLSQMNQKDPVAKISLSTKFRERKQTTKVITETYSKNNLRNTNVSNENISADDHSDEAYLSDCSNSNSGSSPKQCSNEKLCIIKDNESLPSMDVPLVINMKEINPVNNHHQISNVINSVSCEQQGCNGLDNTHLNKTAENKHSKEMPASNKIPQPLKLNENSSENNDTNTLILKTDHNIEDGIVYVVQSSDNVIINDSTDVLEDTTICNNNDKKTPQPSLTENIATSLYKQNIDTNYEHAKKTKNKISESKDVDENNVKEIAFYLKQIENVRKNERIKQRNLKHLDSDKKMAPLQKNTSLHGVEKPGGLIIPLEKFEVNICSRTYKKNRTVRKDIPFSGDSIALSKPDEHQLPRLSTTVLTDLQRQNDLCICFDFGKLSFYDCESVYEHIHFLLHENINCKPEILYSIYNESYTKQNNDNIVTDNEDQEDGINIPNTLCWNKIYSVEDNTSRENQNVRKINVNKCAVSPRCDEHLGKSMIENSVTLNNAGTVLSTAENTSNSTVNVSPQTFNECVKMSVSKTVKSNENVNYNSAVPQTSTPKKTLRTRTEENCSDESKFSNSISKIAENVPVVKQLNVTKDIASPNSILKNGEIDILNDPKAITAVSSNTNQQKSTKRISTVTENLPPSKKNKNTSTMGSNQSLFSTDVKPKLVEIEIEGQPLNRGELIKNSEDMACSSTFADDSIIIEDSAVSDLTTFSHAESTVIYDSSDSNTTLNDIRDMVRSTLSSEISSTLIQCGVCKETMDESQWHQHRREQHNYLAWHQGENQLDLKSNNKKLKKYIQDISNTFGELTCVKCNLVRKKAVPFIRHVLNCTGASNQSLNESSNVENNDVSYEDESNITDVLDSSYEQPKKRRGRKSLNILKCAICHETMKQSAWIEHIGSKHKYLAWTEDETPVNLDDPEEVKEHLKCISKMYGGLTCNTCGLKWSYVKKYMEHICKTKETNETTQDILTCGVCCKSVERDAWYDHVQHKHNYLAWTTDETPLDLEDEEAVKQHLTQISKQLGGLVCKTCNTKWLYAKKYLNHACRKEETTVANRVKKETSRKSLNPLQLPSVVTCALCYFDIQNTDWIKHIEVAHGYMAWHTGEDPIDVNDNEAVKQHLDRILAATGELTCMQCGIKRQTTYKFMQHQPACKSSGFDMNAVTVSMDMPVEEGHCVCGVCLEIVHESKWQNHAMSKHYNIAWKVGENPINLRNPYAVEKHLKLYKTKRGLVCQVCHQSRSSWFGFYAHILTCGRSPEEMEDIMNFCEICNKKYICVYKNQHMASHRDSELRKEKRELAAKKAEENAAMAIIAANEPLTKRRAAIKAKKVIEEHSSNDGENGAVAANGQKHQNSRKKDGNDSDVSVKIENESESSDDEADLVESPVSDEEEEPISKKKHMTTKEPLLLYKVNNYNSYLTNAYNDFVATHYTSESLFNIWRNSDYQVIPSEETEKYLPQIKESCKIMPNVQENVWVTFGRFESRRGTGYCFFTGGAIQCMAWAPHNISDDSLDNYLAISVHRGPDVPRHLAAERPVHPGCLQIWNFGYFGDLPYCALCIAHEYGIVWSMDWCPSGARDLPPPAVPAECHTDAPLRLGLLAIACSNGSVYILAVPEPPIVQAEEPPVYKFAPVAELRLTMTKERQSYQATSVKWSPQKGHSIIIVGYSDGVTALYDLNTESPFLVSTENGVTVYHPFQERRSETSPITSVGLLATQNEYNAVGGQFSASNTGVSLTARESRPCARHMIAATGAQLAPSWPGVMLGADMVFTRSITELEWWGGGRRVGGARLWASCARCARVVSASSPAVRVHKHHPIYPEIKRYIVAMIRMVPFKDKPKVKDDQAVVVEPLTYDEAVTKYGIKVELVKKTRNEQNKANQICNNEELQLDRFPLADVVAMAFCPSRRNHDRLVIATHTGFVLSMMI